ncbi:hypothetical protein PYCCODRAFT_1417511 [Trametes coccinea BRFM310]|uniref:F-box domain-containing protein n=1 Tax=Trametes coccinea (strain BRFM310) TaxID=1353009 RepID=A0A1Y2IBU6_TRAC3|nr:hypothetical protein PYCCODRAFT_1417511 [Trametes coccinea BRFM310]
MSVKEPPANAAAEAAPSSMPLQKRPRAGGPMKTQEENLPCRRGVGKLAGLMHVPMDVFFEILSKLHPLDLLHVSRVSKQLRAVVLSRKSRFLWSASLTSVDELPPCPEDMSEPAYAALLFTRTCTLCGATNASWVDYAIRLRLCKSCRESHIRTGGYILSSERLPYELERLYMAMVPCVTGKHLNTARKLENPLSHTEEEKYYVPQLQAALNRPFLLPHKGQKSEDWLDSVCAKAIAWHKHATSLLLWEADLRCKRRREGRDIKDKWCDSVTQKLLELGYSEDDFPNSMEWRRLLYQRKTLTDRTWNTLRPKLENLIQERKNARYELSIRKDVERRTEQIATLYEELVKTLPEDDQRLMPNAYDACQLPCLVALARKNDAKGDVSPADFQLLRDQLMRDAEAYKSRAKETAVKQIMEIARWHNRQWLDDMEGLSPDQVLKRPYALFKCRRCHHKWGGEYMTFEDIHAHFRATHPEHSWRPEWKPVDWVFECVASYSSCSDILDAAGVPRDTPISVLSHLIKTARLYCSCRDPGLPPPEELDWPKLYAHVSRASERYYRLDGQRLRTKDAIRNAVLKKTHPLSGPNACIKLIPEGADTASARERATLIDPSIRARIEDRLGSWPKPSAIPLCGVCTTMTMKRHLRYGGEGVRSLPETPEGIVHHLREWHEKDFEEKEILFFADGQLAVEQ